MGGTRAAVAASIVSAERDESGAAGAHAKIAAAGFDVDGTAYGAFVDRYFGGAAASRGK